MTITQQILPFLPLMPLLALVAYWVCDVSASAKFASEIHVYLEGKLPESLHVRKPLYYCSTCQSGHLFLAFAPAVLGLPAYWGAMYLVTLLGVPLALYITGEEKLSNYSFLLIIATYCIGLSITANSILVIALTCVQLVLTEVITSMLSKIIED